MPHRLLVVNTSRSWGGNEHWAVRIAAGLARRGHAVRFAWGHPVVGERAAAAGLEGRRVRLRGDADPAGILALAREMRRARADAVLLTKWREYLLGGLAARVGGRPRVVSNISLAQSPPPDLKRRLVVRLADRILVNADEVRDSLVATGWIPAEKIRVVVNGLDLASFRPRGELAAVASGRGLRAALGVPDGAPLIVNVANLVPQKDQANLLQAAARLRERVPDLRVLILGEGMLRDELGALVDRLGLAGRVLMPGLVDDVRPGLAAADLFVLSSSNEGMAWALMEAAAAGLAAVTTDVSGARACVEDGTTGRVVPTGDPDALAGAIAELLADAPRRERMGRAARQLAESRFGEERMLAETERVLFE